MNKEGYYKKYYRKNHEKSIARTQSWKDSNPEKWKEYRKRYYRENHTKIRSYMKERLKNLRYEALTILAKKYGTDIECQCCGEKKIDFLTIDHIVPICKMKEKRLDSQTLLLAIVKYKKIDNYRVLCYNCNLGKRSNNVCPHLDKKL